MIEYQNIFTRVQVHAGAEPSAPMQTKGSWIRQGGPFFNYWLGKFGAAQVGPIYLGGLGVASLLFGFELGRSRRRPSTG